ncbi:hypothetical protein [Pseudogemmobacter bohemicus]|uniref:hypothetical protein n=1 Tax=Pseudogemmobacter bohemicus TaxID=2250708 RepID=UPI0013009CB5|nr:hypothetical protein [Pseudogemmobacter bohemicus]
MTLSLIKQQEEAQRLNDQLKVLAADPLQEWLDGVPTWIEAGQPPSTPVPNMALRSAGVAGRNQHSRSGKRRAKRRSALQAASRLMGAPSLVLT